MPEKKNRPVTHSIGDAPICEECQKHELSFFDPNCPGCSDILLDPETCVPELFAILRQWVPQVQQNLGTFVNEIIKRGTGINDRDGLTDMTLLHYVCKSGAVGVGDIDAATSLATELVSQGADVSVRCRWTDMLPLHYAAFFNSAAVIRVLLKASGGKDIDATCSGFDSGTVLHIAASNLCLDAAKCLLQHGANAFIKDEKNRTPLNSIPEACNFERDSPSCVLANKLRRLLSEAETSGSESGMESATDSGVNVLDILGLRIGDKVMVGDNKVGILRYCGRTDFAKGHWAGVQLEDPMGKNNGSVAGKSYFECKPKHGIFCPLSKISKLDKKDSSRPRSRPNSAKLPSNMPRPLHKRAQHTMGGSLPGSRSSSRSSSPQPKTTNDEDNAIDIQNLEIGNRVVLLGEDKRKGVVRFVGETQFAHGVWVGVELVGASGKNDGSVNGVRYFDCKPKQGLFLHPSKLRREDIHEPSLSSQSLTESKTISTSDDTLNHSRLSSHGGSNPDLSEERSVLRPLSRQLSSSVPDLRKKKHDRKTELRQSGIPRLKGKRKDVKETKAVLKEGVHVYVNSEMGVLRFIGRTLFGNGVWLGVELSKPVGKNDGSVNGQQYFTCKPNHGLFVRPNRATHHGINCSKLLAA